MARSKASRLAAALAEDLPRYLAAADPPILAEFAHRHGLTRSELIAYARDHSPIAQLVDRLQEAREVSLEHGGLDGHFKTTMAIFCLKQLGWDCDSGLDGEDSDASGVIVLGEVLSDA